MLDLTSDAAALTASLVDIRSESGDEKVLADAIESALSDLPHLTVTRDGDAVVARTDLGRPRRVVVAGTSTPSPSSTTSPPTPPTAASTGAVPPT